MFLVAIGRSFMGALLLASRSRTARHRREQQRAASQEQANGQLPFRTVLKDVLHRYTTRTSKAHKRLVFLLIAGAALLRGWMLFQPITYDEAFAWTQFASRPLHVLLSDYSHPGNHILHTLLSKFSTVLFGLSPVSLRVPAYFAGLLALPLYYLLVRSVFNRYIALVALALVCADAGLTEYGALSRGYSLTWLCLMLMLVLGRHLVRTGDRTTALLMGGVCALGMWAVPVMLYPALVGFLWLLFLVLMRPSRQRPRRLGALLLGALSAAGGTLLLYAPVLAAQGAGWLRAHPALPPPSWQGLVEQHVDAAHKLWTWILAAAPPGVIWPAIAGFLFAAYVSVKFRTLALALLLGTAPVVLVQMALPPDQVWLFMVFVLHLGTAISVYYLLKMLHDKVWKGMGERIRSATAALVLFVLFAAWGMPALLERQYRFEEAPDIAGYLDAAARGEDQVAVLFPWEAPVEFHVAAAGLDRSLLHRPAAPGGLVFAVVEQGTQRLETVLDKAGIAPGTAGSFELVQVIGRTKIFAPRQGSGMVPGTSANDAP